MVNEQDFFKKLEEMKNQNKDLEKLKQYESVIRSALAKKYKIRHIQKALKEVYKVKVSEYTLKKFINSLGITFKAKTEVKAEVKSPTQPSQPSRPSTATTFQKVNPGGHFKPNSDST